MAKEGKTAIVPKLRFPEFLDSPAWCVKPLSAFISALDAGVSVNAGDRPAAPTEIGVLKTSCVTNGVFDLSENKVVLDTEEQTRVTECVLGGTIIISRMNTPALVGANAYVESGATNIFLPDRLWAAKPAPDANMRFVAYILGADRGRGALSELAAGSSGSMKNIAKSAVLELLVSAPEPNEQQKIADCLSSLDELIAAQGRKVGSLKTYKRGLMQQLFPREGEPLPRLRFPEFRDAPEWGETPLGYLVGLLSGYPFDGTDIVENSAGVPLMRGINVTEGSVRHSREIDRYYLGPLNGLEKYRLEKNDLVIGMDGSKVGKNSALISEADADSLLIQRVARLRATSVSAIKFIFQQIHSLRFHAYVDRINTSSGIPHISAKQIKEYPIHSTGEEEQQRVAEFLSLVDTQIVVEADKLTALKAHKKGLMQQLFPSLE